MERDRNNTEAQFERELNTLTESFNKQLKELDAKTASIHERIREEGMEKNSFLKKLLVKNNND